jgi:Flp pilus assembly protein TadB
VALFRRSSSPAPAPEDIPAALDTAAGRAKKDRPTPSRKEAEAARRQRVTRTVSKREARVEASRASRQTRMRRVNAREGQPEKVLIRDYVDSRFSIGEFLLPSLLVILAVTFLSQVLPRVTLIATAVMYLFILLVILDGFLMWRRFKKVLASRMPHASTRGLAMYGMNRSIQIRRFRVPPPRVKRGEAF